MSPEFLTVDDVLELHSLQILRFGGSSGVRDIGLLESAVAQPRAGFGDQYVHSNLISMAAAYLFHIVRNHAFVDGNKRNGLVAALVFLDLNGISIEHGSERLYELTMRTAEGLTSKEDIANTLRNLADQR